MVTFSDVGVWSRLLVVPSDCGFLAGAGWTEGAVHGRCHTAGARLGPWLLLLSPAAWRRRPPVSLL